MNRINKNIEKKSFQLIRKQLDMILTNEISQYRNIEWSVKGKRYKSSTEPKYELCILILRTSRNTAPTHKADDKYVSFSSVDLRKKLGVDYQKIIDTAFIKKSVGGGYDMKNDRVTLKYKLRDEIVDIVNRVYNDEELTASHIGRGGLDITRDTLPDYTITNTSRGNNTLTSNKADELESLVYLNAPNIRLLLSVYADMFKKYVENKNVNINDGIKLLNHFGWSVKDNQKLGNERFHNKIENRLNVIKQLVDETHNTQLGIGYIHQLYTQARSGRYFMLNDVNIQNLPKEIRNIVMGGLDYYEYDIVNAHYTFLYQLNKMYDGKSLKFVKKYIENTKLFREERSKELGISIDTIKTILLSVIYGSDIRSRHTYKPEQGKSMNSAIINTLIKEFYGDENKANDAFEVISKDENVVGLMNDVRSFRDLIIDDKNLYGKNRYSKYFYNHFGSKTELEVKGFNTSKGSKLSHVLQGVESFILDLIMDDDVGNVVMLHHDGWVSKNNRDTEVLERIINSRLNYHYETLGYRGLLKISVTKKELKDIVSNPTLDKRFEIYKVEDVKT
tara:strand:+ start:971 stop:2653 length:1683 start_codon:yes stop_codon:yes gene_type:complete